VSLEIFYAFALCYVVLNVATTGETYGNRPNEFFGLAIGFTVVSAAIAAGSISGASLNPAVSIGAMGASWLIYGSHATRFWVVYVFAPFAGACLGTAGFWFVRGGVTGRYEYRAETEDNWEGAPLVKRGTSPARTPMFSPRSVISHSETIHLLKNDAVLLPDEVRDHDLFCGLHWRVRANVSCDIDVSCVKYTHSGQCLGAIYFNERQDMANGIWHSGDECTGNNAVAADGDNERVHFKLSSIRSYVHALFLTATIWSKDCNFSDVEECSVRIVDNTNTSEFCRYEKHDIVKQEGNALIVAMIYRTGDQWYFKPVDECYHIQHHSTYRELDKHLQQLCQRMALSVEQV